MAQSPSNNNQSNCIGKMLNSKEYDFAHCFRPIYYCSRIFGFMPFSIVYDSSAAIHKPSPRAFDLLWFIISISIYVSTIIGFYIQRAEIPFSASQILNDIAWFGMISSLVFGVIGISLDMCNRFKIVNIFNEFNRIDEKV